ncbi:phage portal protein [Paenibacillus sp. GCM10023248]|nr:phage portal protein [Paenibacillus sp. MAHUQ-63]MDD9270231.1 phage portal protein [Paenibacillus sp. MAHUQ-63]
MDTITNAKNSVGVISEETIVANHPWVTNAQDEMKRLESDRMKAMDDLAYEAVQDGILRWSRA